MYIYAIYIYACIMRPVVELKTSMAAKLGVGMSWQSFLCGGCTILSQKQLIFRSIQCNDFPESDVAVEECPC